MNSDVRKWSYTPSLFFNSTGLTREQMVVAMVMGVPAKRSSLYKEMSRKLQKKKREPISDLMPPSTLSTNHVNVLFQ